MDRGRHRVQLRRAAAQRRRRWGRRQVAGAVNRLSGARLGRLRPRSFLELLGLLARAAGQGLHALIWCSWPGCCRRFNVTGTARTTPLVSTSSLTPCGVLQLSTLLTPRQSGTHNTGMNKHERPALSQQRRPCDPRQRMKRRGEALSHARQTHSCTRTLALTQAMQQGRKHLLWQLRAPCLRLSPACSAAPRPPPPFGAGGKCTPLQATSCARPVPP